MAARGSTPFANTRFRVEIDGLTGTGAVEVILPEARRELDAGMRRSTQFGTLTLRRGLSRSSEWYDWWNRAQDAARGSERTVHVVLQDESGADAIGWTFRRALPVGYLVSSLNALGNEPVVESLELRVQGFEATFGATPAKRRKRD